MQRPQPGEYAPYYDRYVVLATSDPLLQLRDQRRDVMDLFGGLSAEEAGYRYASDKWSLRQLLGHMTDADRVFGFRAYCFARGEKAPLPSFDQGVYVEGGRYDARSMPSLVSEFLAVRQTLIELFDSLEPEAWARMGTASDVQVSVRALAFIAAGHAEHHLRVARERYQRPSS